MHLFSVTLQKSSAITAAVYGNFSAPRQQEMVVARGGRVLELLRPDENGKVQLLRHAGRKGKMHLFDKRIAHGLGNLLLSVQVCECVLSLGERSCAGQRVRRTQSENPRSVVLERLGIALFER